MKRLALLPLLLLALLCAMGFVSGAQSDKEEVLEKASFVPKLDRVLFEADRGDLGAL